MHVSKLWQGLYKKWTSAVGLLYHIARDTILKLLQVDTNAGQDISELISRKALRITSCAGYVANILSADFDPAQLDSRLKNTH